MQKLRERLKDQKGFTLVEMLIVVAIIAILIGVSIPLVNSSLEKARQAVDSANMRSALGLANILILEDPAKATGVKWYSVQDEQAMQGTLEDNSTNAVEGKASANVNKYLKVTFTAADPSGTNYITVKASWESKS